MHLAAARLMLLTDLQKTQCATWLRQRAPSLKSSMKQAARLQMHARHWIALLQRIICTVTRQSKTTIDHEFPHTSQMTTRMKA